MKESHRRSIVIANSVQLFPKARKLHLYSQLSIICNSEDRDLVKPGLLSSVVDKRERRLRSLLQTSKRRLFPVGLIKELFAL